MFDEFHQRIIALALRLEALVGIIFGVVMLSGAGPLNAGIYQWTDDQGRVHFGDKPADQGAKQLDIEASKSVAGVADDASRRAVQKKLLDLMNRERQQKKQAKAKRKADKIEQQRRCTILRQELADMVSGGYLYFDYNDAGEREYIDAATQQRKVDEMGELIQTKCD
ncbi:MAG: DUF4124 domain-containing protein [Immundisolibacteraceae bacterium]|nr:DUF4124 domain-containing protein [Immundisolibacteraceae bacterium]